MIVRDVLIAFISTLFSPFISLLIALIYCRQSWTKYVYVFFFAYLGAGMVANSTGMDLYRYMCFLQSFVEIPDGNLMNVLRGKYDTILGATGGVDFYRDVVAYFVSRFTERANILMFFYALIYGYVVLTSINILKHDCPIQNAITFLLLICFFEVSGFRSLGGVRFCTAVYMFCIGVFQAYYDNNKHKGFLIALCSCLFHFSMIIPVILFIGLYHVSIKRSLLMIILIISVILKNMNLDITVGTFSLLENTIYSHRVDIYTNELGIESFLKNAEATVWFVTKRNLPIIYFMYFALFYIWSNKSRIIEDKFTIRSINLSLICIIFSNLFFKTPMFAERIEWIGLVMWTAYIYRLYILNKNKKYIRNIAIGVIVSFILVFLYEIRSVLFITSPYLYIGTSYHILFNNDNTSLYQLIF